MIANVNSFTTRTAVPRSLTQMQLNVMKRRKRCGRVPSDARQKNVAENERLRREKSVLNVLRLWWDTTINSKLERERNRPIAPRLLGTLTSSTLGAKAFSNVSKMAKKVGKKAADWSSVRYVPKVLRFVAWQIPLPSRVQIRGQAKEQNSLQSKQAARAAADAVLQNDAATKVIERFQRQIRHDALRRRRIRLIEFDAWNRDCKRERALLTLINSVFLGLLGVFTMMVCVLLSAAFNDEQCLQWVAAVGQSILMQIVVTAPLLGVVVLSIKIVGSLVLIKASVALRAAERARALKLRAAALAVKQLGLRRRLQALTTRDTTDSSASTGDETQEIKDELAQVERMQLVIERARAKAKASHAMSRVLFNVRNGLKRLKDMDMLSTVEPIPVFKRRRQKILKVTKKLRQTRAVQRMLSVDVQSMDGLAINITATGTAASGVVERAVVVQPERKKERKSLDTSSRRRKARGRRARMKVTAAFEQQDVQLKGLDGDGIVTPQNIDETPTKLNQQSVDAKKAKSSTPRRRRRARRILDLDCAVATAKVTALAIGSHDKPSVTVMRRSEGKEKGSQRVISNADTGSKVSPVESTIALGGRKPRRRKKRRQVAFGGMDGLMHDVEKGPLPLHRRELSDRGNMLKLDDSSDDEQETETTSMTPTAAQVSTSTTKARPKRLQSAPDLKNARHQVRRRATLEANRVESTNDFVYL